MKQGSVKRCVMWTLRCVYGWLRGCVRTYLRAWKPVAEHSINLPHPEPASRCPLGSILKALTL